MTTDKSPGHTPTPWTNDNGLVNGRESRARFAGSPSIDIFDADEWPMELHDEALANAAFIVQAVNAFDANQATISALVAALGAARDELEQMMVNFSPPEEPIAFAHTPLGQQIDAALALAKGEPK